MNKQKISFGPGAASLILIMIILCMTILAMLGLTTAVRDADNGLASARITERIYALSSSAEESLSRLDAILYDFGADPENREECIRSLSGCLPDGMSLQNDIVCWTERDDDGCLMCGVRLWPGNGRRTEWVRHQITFGETEEKAD